MSGFSFNGGVAVQEHGVYAAIAWPFERPQYMSLGTFTSFRTIGIKRNLPLTRRPPIIPTYLFHILKIDAVRASP